MKDERKEILERQRQRDSNFGNAWDRSAIRRAVALVLVRMRKKAGLSQKALAKKANWDQAFVSRLESTTDSMPNLDTIVTYARVCEHDLGIVLGNSRDNSWHLEGGFVTGDGGMTTRGIGAANLEFEPFVARQAALKT